MVHMDWSIVSVMAGAGIAALWGAWWLWWRLPKRQVDRLRHTLRDPKARADVEDNFRKTIGQLLGGAAVLLGAGLAYLQFSQQQQASQRQFSQQQQAARELLISNQVAKGFEQLGSDKIVVRLGGIYALEGVMNTSEAYHQPVLEALSAFVRDGTRTQKGDGPPATDIQAALAVIGRRAAIGTGVPDLANARFPKAYLSGADLNRAHLSGADLSGARLLDARLIEAHLDGARLNGADLNRADLNRAHLEGADLSGIRLIDANLNGAYLTGVHLNGAYLWRAALNGAHLNGADLSGADLSGSTVSQTQLDSACGAAAKLPPGAHLKPCAPP
jgi:Pentapeptide repeats (8 copies)